MHPKFAQRREQLLGGRQFRIPLEYLLKPEVWETWRLPGQKPYVAPEPKIGRLQPAIRALKMPSAEREKFLHEQTRRNVEAYMRNLNRRK